MNKVTSITDEDYEKAVSVFQRFHYNNAWRKVERDDFVIKRFSLGFVNNILSCEIKDEARQRLKFTARDPTGVVIKFLSTEVSFFYKNPAEFGTTNALISEHSLGPRLLFVSEECYVYELFSGSRNMAYEDDVDPETVQECARVLARFHCLQVPLSKEGYEVWNKTFKEMENAPFAAAIKGGAHLKVLDAFPDLKTKYYDQLKRADIFGELQREEKITRSMGSPLVFSHLDFNRGNRLIRRKTDPTTGKATIEIRLVDLDYSNYNARGADLGRYFSNYQHRETMFGDEGFPEDAEMELFLEAYRQECARLLGTEYLDDEQNSMAALIKETKAFTLKAYYVDWFFAIFMLADQTEREKVEYFAKSFSQRFAAYERLLKKFADEGVFSLN